MEERLRTRAICGLGQPQGGEMLDFSKPLHYAMDHLLHCKPSEEKVSRRFSKFKLPPMPRGVYEPLDQDNDALTFLDPLSDTVINFTI